MSEELDFSALKWVKGEINESLAQAQQSLETYLANAEDSTKIQFCITHLHQVWGTLEMVQLEGAAMLAEEMEALSVAIFKGKVSHVQEAQAVLMQGFIKLPAYLDSLSSGSKDMPAVLVPVLNDLRSARGASLTSETELFNPDLESGDRIIKQREESKVDDLENQVQKLRKAYQRSLVAVMNSEALESNFIYIGKILTRLQKVSGKNPIGQIWWIAGAMVDGILNGSIDYSRSVNSLLGAVDRQIKIFSEDPKALRAEKFPTQLVKNLLYYVASGEPSSQRIVNVQRAYKLAKALPEEVRVEQSEQAKRSLVNDSLEASVRILVEELMGVGEILDVIVRNKDIDYPRLKNLLPTVKSIAGALHVMGLTELRDNVVVQYKTLRVVCQDNGIDVKPELMSIAGQLLAVQSSLNNIAKHGLAGPNLIGEISETNKVSIDQLEAAQKALLIETIGSLSTVKEIFALLLAGRWDKQLIEEAVNIITDMSGSLSIVPLTRVSNMLDCSALYLKEELLSVESSPDQKELETFADVLSSIDYYIEKLHADSRTNDQALAIGCERLESLGYAVGNTPLKSGLIKNKETINTESVVLNTTEKVSQDSESDKLHNALSPSDQETDHETNSTVSHVSDNVANDVVANNVINDVAKNTSDNIADDAAKITQIQSNDNDSLTDSDSIIDDDIIEIFIEEVDEVQEALQEFLPKWQDNNQDTSSLGEVRRAFHTLKGSGRMVGAIKMADMAWSIEKMLNRVIDNTIVLNDQVVQLAFYALAAIPELIELFKQSRNESTPRSKEIILFAEKISNNESVDLATMLSAKLAEEILLENDNNSDPVLGNLSDTDSNVSQINVSNVIDADKDEADGHDYDMEIVEIFSQEALLHTQSISHFLTQCDRTTGPWILSDEVLRVMHTLKGCANMAAIEPIAPVVSKSENFIKELRLQDKYATREVLSVLQSVVTLTNRVIEEIPEISDASYTEASSILNTVKSLNDELLFNQKDTPELEVAAQERIARLLSFPYDEIFDGGDYLVQYLEVQNDVEQKAENDSHLALVSEECVGISHLAFECEFDDLGKLFNLIALGVDAAQAQLISESFCQDLFAAIHQACESIDFLAAGQFVNSAEEISLKLQDHLDGLSSVVEVVASPITTPAAAPLEEPLTKAEDVTEIVNQVAFDSDTQSNIVADSNDNSLSASDQEAQEFFSKSVQSDAYSQKSEQENTLETAMTEEDDASEVLEEITPDAASHLLDDGDDSELDVELELVEIFIEEAEEIVESSGLALDEWRNDSHNLKFVEQLQRELHTLKGGARMAQATEIGDFAHELENVYEALVHGIATTSEPMIVFLFECHDRMSEMVMSVKTTNHCEPANDLIERLKKVLLGDFSSIEAKPAASQKDISDQKIIDKEDTKLKATVSEISTQNKSIEKNTTVKYADNADAQKSVQKETIKMPAALLESLVNLAGETSINRGRLEVQMSDFSYTIEEMSGTIDRLTEQLRRLQSETEAQIVFRHEIESPTEGDNANKNFDPLEMDRYSAIDQLSRSLSESVSDLLDLKETLADKIRDSETLLLQQGRVNTELQESLMRSRMVPFSRLLPRLRRIVRQIGNELKKPVDLEILNAEGEFDRAVLERMISPIEHMLRNSIAHGIESADERKKAGKPINGSISINIGREGSNMVIIVKDDGAGINVAKVRKKAVENGLLEQSSELSDKDIQKFILRSGFSTATEVSQVSGRGVGMDVVSNEIKSIGGSIDIYSSEGYGTAFTVRLPFTVAVNRAFMVGLGEDIYAIPLTSIEGVVRISPYELEAYYEQESPIFNYAGVDYDLQYLGSYMFGTEKPNLHGHVRPLPVLLLQGGDHAVAMQVDELLGSREIVVKSVGPQLSTVAGLSGATILGDGSVVIILDIHSMIRGAVAQKESLSSQSQVIEARKKQSITTVMVIDDSVTVRKVTSRLLERNNMQVVLAKDGMDAMTQLQDMKPDVMLLDIEMPRMDGFEVATLVRHDERLKDVPIIMITSRTGEKHKQRAMDIGVNRYMGKPFQEAELLECISLVLAEYAETSH